MGTFSKLILKLILIGYIPINYIAEYVIKCILVYILVPILIVYH